MTTDYNTDAVGKIMQAHELYKMPANINGINGKGKGCEKCRAVREAARKENRGINVLGYYCERCHGV